MKKNKARFEPVNYYCSARPNGKACFKELDSLLSFYLNASERKKIKVAYIFSAVAHDGQLRQSGEPYISHPLAVASICARWRLDRQSLQAALLHDVMEDRSVKKSLLIKEFGNTVANIVDGLSKIKKIQYFRKDIEQAKNFEKILFATITDTRVILIKLADRLHNMRTLGAMPLKKKHYIAKETLEIYAPIAHRLGFNLVYLELQDLSFANLYPKRFSTIKQATFKTRDERKNAMREILENLNDKLESVKIEAKIYDHEKNLYGIYRRMTEKKLKFSEVLDIYGFFVVVSETISCYTVLGILHSLYKPIPGGFRDYIALPKLNGYQSLLTIIIGPFGIPVEFQIRTEKMHCVAEFGVVGDWLLQSKPRKTKKLNKDTHLWFQSLLHMKGRAKNSIEFIENLKRDLCPEIIHVFTPKSKTVTLLKGSTAIDFAYAISTDVGNNCIVAKINRERMPLNTEIKNGDIVEIITQPGKKPSINWLNFAKTARARSEIKYFLKSKNEKDL